jgi:hypothetical protein
MRPSGDVIARAAEVLSRLAGIRGFAGGGYAVFRGAELERVGFEEATGDGDRFDGVRAYIPAADAFGSEADLLEACGAFIQEGIWNREDAAKDVLPHFFEFLKEGRPGAITVDDLRLYASWLDDGGKWRERIDAQWPVLTLAAGGEDR